MSDEDDPDVQGALRAIAAGDAVDWPALESSASDTSSRDVLRELKRVAGIAEFLRTLQPSPESPASPESAGGLAKESGEIPAGAPTTWGSLAIVEELGRGAFGRVYRAWDPRLDRDVALKLIDQRHAPTADAGLAVVEEGRLLARLRHPNIVTIHGADRIDGWVGLEMELVAGRTLDRIVRDHGPLGADEAAVIGRDVCRALAAIHRAGLVHRDVKAQNVMRESGGRIVLMDMGAGREADEIRSGALVGTPLYLAPEVLAGSPATPSSDLYGLGVLIYFLVTGAFPIRGHDLADLRAAHDEGRSTRLRDARPDLPERFIQVIERAFARNPMDRFDSAGRFEAALSETFGREDRVAPIHAPTRWIWIAASAAVIGLATWIAWPRLLAPPEAVRFSVTLEDRLSTPSAPGAAEFALSPDGSRFVYSTMPRGGPESHVRLRSIDALESTLIPGVDGGQPFFSPDGRWIGYHHTEPHSGRLVKTPIDGGPSVDVVEWARPGGASWDRNGTIVFSANDDLWRVSDAGGTPTRLTTVDQSRGESAVRPQVLPNGCVLFTLRRRAESQLAVRTREGTIHVVLDSATNGKFMPPGYISFIRGDWIMAAPFDARRLEVTGSPVRVEKAPSTWFDVSSTGALVLAAPTDTDENIASLVWVDRRTGLTASLPSSFNQARYLPDAVRLSPDGRQLAMALSDDVPEVVDDETTGRLWIGDVARGTMTALTNERVRLLAWTPDSARLTFRNATGAIVWKRTDGTGAEQTLATAETGPFDRCSAGSWAPDGRLLVLACGNGAKALTFSSADEAGHKPPAVAPFIAGVGLPQFSTDGRWIAYQAGIAGVGASQQIFVRPFPGPGSVVPISTRGRNPVWRGRELFFLQRQTPMVVTIDTGSVFQASQPRVAIQPFNYDTSPGTIVFDVSPDGQRFLVLNVGGTHVPNALTHLNVVLHWVEEVKNKIAQSR